MSRFITVLILSFLAIGIIYRLLLTYNGNFLFNMDNGRDMVDVREMVTLNKLRFTGPSSAIDGFYNGPAWYLLLAIPFIVSGGDPYASILMEIVLWGIGGFFLLKLVSRWGSWLILPIGSIWIASDYIVLANRYAFNPNPVILLIPVFIYLLLKYLKEGKAVYGILTWFLGGLFFNFEMNFGIFVPLIILSSLILAKKKSLIMQWPFWFGVAAFVSTLLPQVIFDLRHQFIMSKGIMRHLSENVGSSFNFLYRIQIISQSFFNTFLATIMNLKLFTWIILVLMIPLIYRFIKGKDKDELLIVALGIIFIPFLGYMLLPVTVNPWHLGAEMGASLVLIAYLLKKLLYGGFRSKITSVVLTFSITWFSFSNIVNFFANDFGKPNLDPSLYKNEIAAIDYVYKYANGENFKVYTYLPSVIDYPYQYLIWWHGVKKFGYLPEDYAYAPNKPQYISNKTSFSATQEELKKRKNSNLVFLIKEPNMNYTRFGWEGDFVKLQSLSKEMVGSLEIEVKKEFK